MSSPQTPDSILVKQFTLERSQEALEQLIKRHSKMVYSVCYRILQDTHWAEDASQKVFLIFVKKAQTLHKDSILEGWFHRTALWEAKNLRRALTRKEHYEMKAHLNQESNDSHQEQWDEIKPHLDEAIEKLPQKLRESVVLCFLKEKSQREAAKILGYSESTISRQLDKAISILQSHFKSSGVTLSAVTLGTLLSTKTSEAIGPQLIANTLTATSTALTQTTLISQTAITLITMKKTIATTAIITGAIASVATYQVVTHSEKPASENTPLVKVQVDDSSKQKEIDRLKKEDLQKSARIIELESALAKSAQQLEKAEQVNLETTQELDSLGSELLVTYGTFEEAGVQFATVVRKMQQIQKDFGDPKKLSPDRKTEYQKAAQKVVNEFMVLPGLLSGVKNLDSSPKEAAGFQSAFYASLFDLAPERTEQIQKVLTNGYQQMNQAGLNTAATPTENKEAWEQRRTESYQQITSNISTLFTAKENKEMASYHQLFHNVWNGQSMGTIGSIENSKSRESRRSKIE